MEQTTHFVFWVSLGKGETMTGSKEQRRYGIPQSTLSGREDCLPAPPLTLGERVCKHPVLHHHQWLLCAASFKEKYLFFLEMLVAPAREVLC